MQLNVTIDLGDLWDEDKSVGDILKEELQQQVIAAAAKTIGGKHLEALAEKMSTQALNEIEKLMRERVENFFKEDIALTGKWGKPEFVGTIEDLMKKQFDETLFRPVDSSGKTLQGCTSSSMTYAEWFLKKEVNDLCKYELKDTVNKVTAEVKNSIRTVLEEHKNKTIKDQVGIALNAILGK